eukprot:CAMPEP_0113949692 /NCGR_PEP_ID=MMETSP1339-20121228/77047_1 /TAXON_ID=94617 /ORGANISM="Fibrocapsa japonica" /LENGTH=218 /DNA_ID=CAMNT_0000957239 /DNA_START=128 /DNA_END=784 /DNA_ORIENTATION=- /assembly_acc=CAM_ASM_000762
MNLQGSEKMTTRSQFSQKLAVSAACALSSASFIIPSPAEAEVEYATAIFAGGCFWCMEPPFDKMGPGVISTVSGYCGGKEENPDYNKVSLGLTSHAESLQVTFDPSIVSYEELLDVFWHQIDPTVKDQQFCDKGKQYRSAIFYSGDKQKKLALESKEKYETMGVFSGPILTEITPATQFWPAEEYHQDYYLKKPMLYKYYRGLCGRDKYLDQVWGPKT